MMTPEAARAALAAMRPSLVVGAVKGALRAGAGRIKRRAVKDFLASGVGRGVFVRDAGGTGKQQKARGKKNAEKLLTVSRVETAGLTAKATATASGFAALAETGGRTEPHVLQAMAPSKLPGGRPITSFGPGEVAAGPIKHPGGSVRKNAAMGAALAAEDPKIAADITRRLDALVEKHLG